MRKTFETNGKCGVCRCEFTARVEAPVEPAIISCPGCGHRSDPGYYGSEWRGFEVAPLIDEEELGLWVPSDAEESTEEESG